MAAKGGMDLVLSGSMGNTAVALIKNKALKPGTVLLELLYVSEVVAPRSRLRRYWRPPRMRPTPCCRFRRRKRAPCSSRAT